jgi:bifunctional DNA-binding transcriptional regulator/antitoxin component of YhaV-PrlF toxin-antitoxin module
LPQEALDEMGLGIGDEIDLTIVEKALVLRRVDEAERGRRVQESTEAVLERRKSAYERLAKGTE